MLANCGEPTRHAPFVKLLVDRDELGALILLDGVPRSRVALGPDNWEKRANFKAMDTLPGQSKRTSGTSCQTAQIPASSNNNTADDNVAKSLSA